MQAVTILKNEANNHCLLQTDVNMLADNEEQLEDLYDIIAVELRKMEKSYRGNKLNTMNKLP